MSGYGAREVARMLGLSVGQIRSFVKAGFLDPARGPRGELRFSFEDLLLLKTAKGLVSARIPPRRIQAALRKLRKQLPEGRPLRAVQIRAEGDRIVVGDGESQWSPESGQTLFDFSARELPVRTLKLHARTADDWYERGCDLEESAPEEAQEAYRQALKLDADNADAWVNLGRLLHESGQVTEAVMHYRRAIELRPEDSTALFNLGVALTDLRMHEEAVLAYRTALAADEGCADAHYNLAHVYESLGDTAAAIRHLRAYRKLVAS